MICKCSNGCWICPYCFPKNILWPWHLCRTAFFTKQLPSKGICSDVTGIASLILCWKTVNERRTVTPEKAKFTHIVFFIYLVFHQLDILLSIWNYCFIQKVIEKFLTLNNKELLVSLGHLANVNSIQYMKYAIFLPYTVVVVFVIQIRFALYLNKHFNYKKFLYIFTNTEMQRSNCKFAFYEMILDLLKE